MLVIEWWMSLDYQVQNLLACLFWVAWVGLVGAWVHDLVTVFRSWR